MNAHDSLSGWRSPLASIFAEDAQWTECGDSEIVESFAGESASPPAGVCDLSPLSRAGAKGECSAAAPPPNTSALMPDGALCCRLGADEVLLLATLSSAAIAVDKKIMPLPRVLIPRRDSYCQIGLCGAESTAVLARLCAVPPPLGNELLQTRVAEVSAIVVAEPRVAGVFYLLTDSGYAVHLWKAVVVAAAKTGGGVVGWTQWRGLFSAEKPPEKPHDTAQ